MGGGTRLRIYTTSDVERHASKGDCWIVRAGRVYGVTEFLGDHPGGNDLILRYAGKDVGDAMTNPSEHNHSQAAYDILKQYAIGRIGTTAAVVRDDWVATDDFYPDETLPDDDYKKNEFLDLSKPLIRQVWESNFSKEFYLQQIHQPRHVTKTARFFGPDYLEIFTRTEWYVVPIIWLPITIIIFIRSSLQFSRMAPPSVFVWSSFSIDSITAISLAKTTSLFIIGLFLWTLLEYVHHRYLFHLDRLLPDTPGFLTAHFLLHGVHHFLPMDRLRLVLPPPMFAVLQFPFTRLVHVLFSPAVANGLISGVFAAYVMYDCIHYGLHHTYLPGYIREMKRYHLSHHYKNFDLGFGITSKLWDYVFNTVIV